ncbi:hypothetical protein KL930_004403 [Ogataea haglerorum]|uniref:uncharacterized protein n=1 Tax=Ogataea haglerorum TaxID=1937702 RepID=UPI001C8A54CE|nr:uncharacterized protein KL911_004757 [Ogataea haglerorum]KAG7692613.1 hypothetical protein KL915_004660 [Ogataea haglerorum]KAG7735569.1 hypothetical protein KL932_004517 [Ogataea haglerorum]KAG7746495.1 hypothetical protein KL912_004426 [Ogataea haglerorum]KAG7750025.1 hypothetical protein KL911_004757 [Ogataea haglerorum]KAG7764672.1 hypothetical protein KL931_004599 [Ogataea haglerorum]
MSSARKKVKKTVSFSRNSPSLSDRNPSTEPGSPVPESAFDLADEEPKLNELPKPSPAFMLLPFHSLAIVYALFHHYNISSKVIPALNSSTLAVLTLHFGFGLIALTTIKNKKKAKRHRGPNGGELVYLVISSIISCFAAIPIFVILLVFGAPIGSLTKETAFMALHLSFLTVFPLLLVYKLTDLDAGDTWIRLLTFQVPAFYKNQVYLQAMGSLVGCWLGVIPIPLDWDRDWQQWPITLLTGAYVGSFAGSLISYLYSIFE